MLLQYLKGPRGVCGTLAAAAVRGLCPGPPEKSVTGTLILRPLQPMIAKRESFGSRQEDNGNVFSHELMCVRIEQYMSRELIESKGKVFGS